MTKEQFFGGFRLAWRIYGFAIVMALLAIIPGCNFLYSGHGGPAWLILPFVFPYALLQLFFVHREAAAESRSATRFVLLSLTAYLPLSFLAAAAGAASIKLVFGLPVEPIFFWGMLTLPFGLIFCGSFFGL